jgi:hypothetical protein
MQKQNAFNYWAINRKNGQSLITTEMCGWDDMMMMMMIMKERKGSLVPFVLLQQLSLKGLNFS